LKKRESKAHGSTIRSYSHLLELCPHAEEIRHFFSLHFKKQRRSHYHQEQHHRLRDNRRVAKQGGMPECRATGAEEKEDSDNDNDSKLAWLVGCSALEAILRMCYRWHHHRGERQGPTNMIKDLLASAQIRENIPTSATVLLQALLGSPEGLNLRNICWHGFLSSNSSSSMEEVARTCVSSPSQSSSSSSSSSSSLQQQQQQHNNNTVGENAEFLRQKVANIRRHLPHYTSFLFILILSLVHEKRDIFGAEQQQLESDNITTTTASKKRRRRPTLKNNFPKDEIFLSHLWHTANISNVHTAMSAPGEDGEEDMKEIYKSACLVLPQIEMSLRTLYVHTNGLPRAMMFPSERSLFSRLDQFLEPRLSHQLSHGIDPCEGKSRGVDVVANKLFTVLEPGILHFLADLCLSRKGPRLRDRVAHGECTFLKSPNASSSSSSSHLPALYVQALEYVLVCLKRKKRRMMMTTRGGRRRRRNINFTKSNAPTNYQPLCPPPHLPVATEQQQQQQQHQGKTRDIGSCEEEEEDAAEAANIFSCYIPRFSEAAIMARCLHFFGCSIKDLLKTAAAASHNIGVPPSPSLSPGVTLRPSRAYKEVNTKDVWERSMDILAERCSAYGDELLFLRGFFSSMPQPAAQDGGGGGTSSDYTSTPTPRDEKLDPRSNASHLNRCLDIANLPHSGLNAWKDTYKFLYKSRTNFFPGETTATAASIDDDFSVCRSCILKISRGFERAIYHIIRKHTDEQRRRRGGRHDPTPYRKLVASIWALAGAAIVTITSLEILILLLSTQLPCARKDDNRKKERREGGASPSSQPQSKVNNSSSCKKDTRQKAIIQKFVTKWVNNVSRLEGLLKRNLYADCIHQALDHIPFLEERLPKLCL